MLFLYRTTAKLPLFLLHFLGAIFGKLTWLLSPTYRRRIYENSAQAGYAFSEVEKSITAAGKMVFETPRLWFGAPVKTTWQGREKARSAYESGRGVVFLTPHLGCFEITAQALAEEFSKEFAPITVLYRPPRQKALAQVIEKSRQREGLQTAPTTLAGVRQMMRALKSGGAVGLLPDQVPPEGMGEWLDFFDKPAYTMTLAAKLILQTGAVPMLVWGERLPNGKGYIMHCENLESELPKDIKSAAQQINKEMEKLIRKAPQQYLWGYGRYKKPRENL